MKKENKYTENKLKVGDKVSILGNEFEVMRKYYSHIPYYYLDSENNLAFENVMQELKIDNLSDFAEELGLNPINDEIPKFKDFRELIKFVITLKKLSFDEDFKPKITKKYKMAEYLNPVILKSTNHPYLYLEPGQKVFDINYGWGTVIKMHANGYYLVDFPKEERAILYNQFGMRNITSPFPTLSAHEYSSSKNF